MAQQSAGSSCASSGHSSCLSGRCGAALGSQGSVCCNQSAADLGCAVCSSYSGRCLMQNFPVPPPYYYTSPAPWPGAGGVQTCDPATEYLYSSTATSCTKKASAGGYCQPVPAGRRLLNHESVAWGDATCLSGLCGGSVCCSEVGWRCRLTVTKPVLKAPMFSSALETMVL